MKLVIEFRRANSLQLFYGTIVFHHLNIIELEPLLIFVVEMKLDQYVLKFRKKRQ